VQLAVIGEGFLRKASFRSSFPHTFSQRKKDLLHPRKSGITLPKRLQVRALLDRAMIGYRK